MLVLYPPNDGTTQVLAMEYEGKKFNSPNDLWIDPEGGVYFTDPRYGNRDDMEMGEHVYYLTPKRDKIIRVIDDFVRPNGIIGTPDETPEKPLPHRPFTTRRVAHQHEHDQFRLFQPGPSPLGVSTHSTRPTPCMSEYRGFIDHRLSALMEHDPGTDGQSRIQGTADRPPSATPGRRLGRVFASRP